MRRAWPSLLLCAAAAACVGTVPQRNGNPERGIASVIIASRLVLPTGETNSGRIVIGLESEEGRDSESYRLPLHPQEIYLFQVEPGTYHLTPARSLFGQHLAVVKARIEGRTYQAAFPREILRRAAIEVPPTKVVSIGMIVAEVESALPGRKPVLKVRLDDSVDTRRRIVQSLIRDMLDPTASRDLREGSIAWTQALDQTLQQLQAETQRAPLYKPAP